MQAAFETNNIPFPQVENQFGGTSIYIQRETESQETEKETIQKNTLKSVEKIINDINESPSITVRELTIKVGLTRRGVEKQIATLKSKAFFAV